VPEARRSQHDAVVRNGIEPVAPRGRRGESQAPAARRRRNIAHPRVLVADDAPTRAGLRIILERNGFRVCAEAETAPDAVESALRDRPHLCLLAVELPGGGIGAAAEISKRLPETAIVVLTVSDNDDDLLDAVRVGAIGYLCKDIDPARVPQALRAVLRGEAAISRTLVMRLLDEIRRDERHQRVSLAEERGVTLTRREWEVLDLVRDGLTTGEIAERLFVTPETVRTHIAAAMRKLEVPDREAALRLLEPR